VFDVKIQDDAQEMTFKDLPINAFFYIQNVDKVYKNFQQNILFFVLLLIINLIVYRFLN